MGLKPGIVRLDDYNSEWVNEFLKEKEILKDMFGDIALSLEHIGSTSIEGLSAKPIIDIAVGVDKLSDFLLVKNKFLDFPYSVKEDSTPGEILVKKSFGNDITHFIHVMEINDSRYIESILFRNYLRNHREALIEYENLKKDLASKYSNDRKTYTSLKNDFIKEIINKAYYEERK